MKVGQSKEFLNDFQRDLAAEQDPAMRGWYEIEMQMQPDYHEALETTQLICGLGNALTQLAEQKNSTEIVDVNPADDDPKYISEEELALQTLTQTIWGHVENYERDLAEIESIPKKSKRDVAQRQLCRQYAKDLTVNLIPDEGRSIVHNPPMLEVLLENLNDDLAEAVVDNISDYASNEAVAIATDSVAFANIIAKSAEDSPVGNDFDTILKAMFKNVGLDISALKMHCGVAGAAIELLDNPAGIKKALSIINMSGDTIQAKSLYIKDINVKRATSLMDGNIADYVAADQATIIFNQLQEAFPDITSSLRIRISQYNDRDAVSAELLRLVDAGIYTREAANAATERIANETEWLRNVTDRDPVTVIDGLTGEKVESLSTDGSFHPEFKEAILADSLYQKRMRYLSPIPKADKVARDAFPGKKIKRSSFALTPGKDLSICVPYTSGNAVNKKDMQTIKALATSQLLKHLVDDTDISSAQPYDTNNQMTFVTIPVMDGDEQIALGIVHQDFVTTPVFGATSRLFLAFSKLLASEKASPGFSTANKEAEFKSEHQAVKQDIEQNYRRFLGRRPVSFRLPSQIRQSGLKSIQVSQADTSKPMNVNVIHDDGIVNLKMSKDFTIIKSAEQLKKEADYPRLDDLYLELMVAKLVAAWITAPSIETSEGTVSEDEPSAVNMGTFAYLPIKDGKMYNYSEKQWDIYAEERGKDLGDESDRLRDKDPTGKGRNSTYRREKYDPSKPPLEVYYDESIIS